MGDRFLATKKMLQVGVLTKITKSPHNRSCGDFFVNTTKLSITNQVDVDPFCEQLASISCRNYGQNKQYGRYFTVLADLVDKMDRTTRYRPKTLQLRISRLGVRVPPGALKKPL